MKIYKYYPKHAERSNTYNLFIWANVAHVNRYFIINSVVYYGTF